MSLITKHITTVIGNVISSNKSKQIIKSIRKLKYTKSHFFNQNHRFNMDKIYT